MKQLHRSSARLAGLAVALRVARAGIVKSATLDVSRSRPALPMKCLSFLAVGLLVIAGCDDVTRPETTTPIRAPQFSHVLSSTITDLGTLGGCCGVSLGINELGNVVGSSSPLNGPPHPFFWSAAGGMIDLGTLGGTRGQANAINDLGQVVGQSRVASGFDHAFLWTASEGMIDLGSLTGENSDAQDINHLGHVVGSTSTPVFEVHAFLWTPQSGMVDLGTLGSNPGFTLSIATGISDQGHVVGVSTTPTGEFHAFLWTSNTGMRDLGTLGGSRSVASDVNALGHVVGNSENASGGTRAFLWTPANGMVDLGTLPGGSNNADAIAINDRGEVVGFANGPFLWSAGAGMHELPPLRGGGGISAQDLNEVGQIVGVSAGPNRPGQAVLWSVQPAANAAPIADAGPDQTVEWTSGGVSVTLDGTSSSDPDSDQLTFSWTDANNVVVGTGPTPTIDPGSLGSHTITLTVNDGQATDTDDVVIDVVDTTPPNLTVTATPASLWPPNHKYVTIGLSVVVSDACDTNPVVTAVVESSEPDDANGNGDGRTTGDIRVTTSGGSMVSSSNASPEVAFDPVNDQLEVRAERAGRGAGRTYTIAVTATDASGNVSTETVTVTVPHDRR